MSERKLLALHGGALGDFILSWPTIEYVKTSYDCQSVSIVARSGHAELAVALGVAREGLDLETAGLHGLFAPDGPSALLDHRRKWLRGFAVVLHFLGDSEGALTRNLALIAAGPVIGVRPPREWTGSRHAALVQLEQAGGSGEPRLPKVEVPQLVLDRVLRWKNHVVIHPGGGSPRKRWPAANFVQLGQRLETSGVKTVVVLGPVERESWPSEDLDTLGPVAAPLDLVELAALSRVAAAFVGNDSGPAHLAALVGAAAVVLFGPTDPAVWRPLGQNVAALRAGTKDVKNISVDAALRATLAAAVKRGTSLLIGKQGCPPFELPVGGLDDRVGV